MVSAMESGKNKTNKSESRQDKQNVQNAPNTRGETEKGPVSLPFAASLFKRTGLLESASFICGTAVMVLEMAGSRVVAPYVGTSQVVWTALIGVIMASLSLGYWLGGRVSDVRPEQKMLARIVMLAALLTGLTGIIANPLLTFLSRSVESVYVGSVFAALLLFALPSVLLGMVSPFIVRLAMSDVGSSGKTVGRFSALSSAGSILGTFLGGFVLISFFSSGTILFLVACTLACVAFMLYRSAWKKAALICAVFLSAAVGTGVWGMPMMPPGDHIDTRYNHIWIAEQERSNGRRARFMMTASIKDGAQSIIYTDNPSELVSDYTKFYDLAFHFKPDAKKILMLGGGGYCVPRHLAATRSEDQKPSFSLDVVEIDPGITAAARKYFSLKDNPAIAIHHEDARIFLNRAARAANSSGASADVKEAGAYDAVFADVFGASYSIPFHLATLEAARAMRDILAPDGVLVSNVISSLHGERSGVFHGIYAALSEVFPRVLIFPAQRPEPSFAQVRQNIMIVALKSDAVPPVLSSEIPEISRLLSHRWTAPFAPTVPAFTDAFAPVEIYALKD